MLQSANRLTGFSLVATDGDLGSVDTVFFDDAHWTIRYLVVDTGHWLSGRKVLISPRSVRSIDWDEGTIQLSLTQAEVEGSPGIDTDKPVSRQLEVELHEHFGYPYYWTGPFVWGVTAFPDIVLADADDARQASPQSHSQERGDPHLRSCKEVVGYAVNATDDSVGHVEDFLFDERSWTVEQIVVDPRNWLPGKHVLIVPEQIKGIEWADQCVTVSLSRDAIENSPHYDAHHPPPSRTDWQGKTVGPAVR